MGPHGTRRHGARAERKRPISGEDAGADRPAWHFACYHRRMSRSSLCATGQMGNGLDRGYGPRLDPLPGAVLRVGSAIPALVLRRARFGRYCRARPKNAPMTRSDPEGFGACSARRLRPMPRRNVTLPGPHLGDGRSPPCYVKAHKAYRDFDRALRACRHLAFVGHSPYLNAATPSQRSHRCVALGS